MWPHPGAAGSAVSGRSRAYFRDLFGPLLDRRQLLLVHNRGTGKSDAIRCRRLQSYQGDYEQAVGRCGRRLGRASDRYGSRIAARDLVAVLDHLDIDRIDLYGDSYGMFFGQTFAVRHPERLRTLMLDAAYFVGGTDPWYTDTNRALRRAFRLACRRSPTCAERPGGPIRRIARLTRQVREDPIVGRAPNADGIVRRAEVDVDATYVEVANLTHVSALVDFDRCASRIVRRFVRTTLAGDTSCARRYHENRLVETFARRADGLGYAGPRRRTARVAAATVADVMARWPAMAGRHGVGLRGGRFTTAGGAFTSDRPVVRWRLHRVRWVGDVAVSGSMTWHRRTGTVRARVVVSGSGAVDGRLRLRWDDSRPRARATAHGRLAGRPVTFGFPAPRPVSRSGRGAAAAGLPR